MLHLRQIVFILIVSCFTVALTERDSNILPGKYHAYNQPHHQNHHHSKKLHAASLSSSSLSAKGLDLHHTKSLDVEQPSTRQENPIKNWFGIFNRNNSKQPPAVAAQDTQTNTCSCR